MNVVIIAMNCIYNAILNLLDWAIQKAGSMNFVSSRPESKLRKFVLGQKAGAYSLAGRSGSRKVLWVHASSFGEFNIARPLIVKLKEDYGYYIVMTFFSPTGYEAVRKMSKDASRVDEVLYLPLDTPKRSREFIEALRPERCLFMVSEIWINYLRQLKRRRIPAYLVSAKISRKSAAVRWYGAPFREALKCFSKIMVLDAASEASLRGKGLDNVLMSGDPLFDNALSVAETSYSNRIIEAFCSGADVFIAGSVSDRKDLRLVSFLANAHRDRKFIFVPHAVSEEILNEMIASVDGVCMLYSECGEDTDFSGVQVLVIDFLGALSRIYRFCRYAYVGGGFTPYLHSVIEATVYGLPVAFGPEIDRKHTPQELVSLGIGCVVRSEKELDAWFRSLKDNEKELERIKSVAADYAKRNSGATEQVVRLIMER